MLHAAVPVAGAMAPIVVEAVEVIFPFLEVFVPGEAHRFSVAAVQPAGPVGFGVVFRVVRQLRVRGGENLRATGRTSEHAVGEAPHLGVPAFAGVAADDIGESDYLPQRLEGCSIEETTTGDAARRHLAQGTKFVGFAGGTCERRDLGSWLRARHRVVLSSGGYEPDTMMSFAPESHIPQMYDFF